MSEKVSRRDFLRGVGAGLGALALMRLRRQGEVEPQGWFEVPLTKFSILRWTVAVPRAPEHYYSARFDGIQKGPVKVKVWEGVDTNSPPGSYDEFTVDANVCRPETIRDPRFCALFGGSDPNFIMVAGSDNVGTPKRLIRVDELRLWFPFVLRNA